MYLSYKGSKLIKLEKYEPAGSIIPSRLKVKRYPKPPPRPSKKRSPSPHILPQLCSVLFEGSRMVRRAMCAAAWRPPELRPFRRPRAAPRHAREARRADMRRGRPMVTRIAASKKSHVGRVLLKSAPVVRCSPSRPQGIYVYIYIQAPMWRNKGKKKGYQLSLSRLKCRLQLREEAPTGATATGLCNPKRCVRLPQSIGRTFDALNGRIGHGDRRGSRATRPQRMRSSAKACSS